MTPPAREFPPAGGLPILLVHAPERGRALVERLRGRPFRFACVVAHTETAEIDGISAAGETPELRRFTAAADAEALYHGAPRCIRGVPSNPRGAPGPVLISLAGLELTGAPATVYDLGLRVPADAPTTRVDDRWGRSILTGDAVPHAAELFERGLALGAEVGAALARTGDYLVLAESVPGGTTTALALLCGLGYDAWGRVSGSMPGNVHALKNRVARAALAAAGLPVSAGGSPPGLESAPPGDRRRPLDVARAVGDPMQPFAAGLALAAHRRAPVLLAGGSQMAAVLALLLAVAEARSAPVARENLAIATTGWVARDPAADLAGLAAEIDGTARALRPADGRDGDARSEDGAARHGRAGAGIPVLASALDFGRSRHAPLRRYERFLVKEGVGAGAAAVAAALATGASADAILARVEAVYERIYGLGGEAVPDTIPR